MTIQIPIPPESVDAIARRAAELVLEQLEQPTDPREWLTVPEAAEYLRCKPQRIYELRSSGRLPSHTEGGRALVRRRDLDGLIEGGDAALSPAQRRRTLRSA